MLERLRLADIAIPPEDISVERASGRNDNTVVRCKGRGSYFIKRAYADNSSAARALSYEAAFCRFFEERDTAPQPDGLVPRLAAYDAEHCEFAYVLLEEATTLWSAYDGSFAVAVALEAGKRLAHLHRRCTELATAETRAWIVSEAPAAFRIHRPAPGDLSVLTAAAYKVITIVQQRTRICEQLDLMRERWEHLGIIHGDIRSDNVLVRYEGDSNKRPVVHFVDFETVQFGDPAWDVAGALQDAVLFWLYSMTPSAGVDLMVASAGHSLGEVQTLARALLHGYFSECALERREWMQFVDRTIRFSAVRMLQSAYEAAADSDDLPAPSVLLLQLAENVLNDPQGAARSFYGLALA